jgi:hypothetical protein
MPLSRKYYFGRLNVMAQFEDYEEKGNLIFDLISRGESYPYRNYHYTFAEPEKAKGPNGDEYFTGYLVKYSKTGRDETVDTESQSFGTEKVDNKTEAKVRFFVHPKKGLIMHHASGSTLSANSFRNRFAELLKSSRKEGFFQAEVQVINDQDEIFREMEELKSITNVKVSLHPSNPNPNPTYEDIDEDLRDKNAQKYVEEYDSGDGALNIKDDEEVRKKISMANDGYGHGKVSGIDENGEKKTVATDDQPTSEDVPIEENLNSEDILSILGDKIKSIMGRFEND